MEILPIPKPLPSVPLYNDINKNNIIELQLIINYIIDSSSLIALDTEFTGLGRISDGIRAQNLEDRYKALKNVVSNYALVAFGLSLFQKSPKSKEEPNCIQFQNHSFNFLMLSQQDYMQSSKSMKFLIENGFDFNTQALKGIPYFPGENKRKNDNNPLTQYNNVMRRIFNRILKRARKVPVVVHNGLMDLMFLYQSFFAPLPDKLDVFLADLSKMFPSGIYDTKYIADYVIRESSSFLSYLFRKEERMQLYNKNIKNSQYIKCLIKKRINFIEELKKEKIPMKRPLDTGKIYCEQYAAHGFCIFGKECTKTHNLDVILDEQMKEKLKPSKRKRRKDRKKMRLEMEAEESNQSKEKEITSTTTNSDSLIHNDNDNNNDSNNNNNNNNEESENSTSKINETNKNIKENNNENSESTNEKSVNEKENTNDNSNNSNDKIINKKLDNEVKKNEIENESNEEKPKVLESLIIYEDQKMLDKATELEKDTPETLSNDSTSLNTNQVFVKNFKTYHSAYFDAFMTGYIFCCQCIECEEEILNSDHVNKLYVIGKSLPLLIRSSPFTKNSEHCLKILETF
ncbi:ribonuclease CAF1 [Neocallimastix lanati (nom. inval.)]|nr:ribonuclease CAF1 [Neocallimastix sp. JGI-2020a]